MQIGNSDFYNDLLFYHKASLSGLLTATNTFSLPYLILAAASKTFISASWANIHFLLYTLEIPVFV
ncbi:hypothetical protein DXT99_20000 [Pontibacter diazotrophicus]|uniref:Uncharacterized protein n=1 Tax=Pontibacter diazotrophicus TaxID=1400979 RepID=A0A3D8L7N9_9BACT|nr:hypothetical protein DXT99_20000 [Pontibacter diazotrophicus]